VIISPTDSSIAPARSSHAGRTLASGPGSSLQIHSESALSALGLSAGLPPELAIFSGEIDDAILHESALRARTLGVGGEAVLIGQGHVSEEAYYERLAEALGVRLAAQEEDFAVTLDWRAALRTGVAPLQGAAWLSRRGLAIADRENAAAKICAPRSHCVAFGVPRLDERGLGSRHGARGQPGSGPRVAGSFGS
jgi:hypothetical protein